MNGWRLAFAAAAILLSTASAASPAHPPAETTVDTQLAGHQVNRGGQPSFQMESNLSGNLYPGKSRQIKLVVLNPNGYPIQVSQIRARLISASRHDCPPNSASLVVGSYSGRLPIRIAARVRTRLSGTIPVQMPKNVSPACAGVRFTIALDGKTVQVDR